MEYKKYFTDGLVQIAILLSLLRTDWGNYLNSSLYDGYPEVQEIIMGPMSGFTQTYIHGGEWYNNAIGLSHPKALSYDFQSSVFQELHSLGATRRYDRIHTEIDAYLVDTPGHGLLPSEQAHATPTHNEQVNPGDNNNNHSPNASHPSEDTTNSGRSQTISSPNVEGASGPEHLTTVEGTFSFSFSGSELTKEDMDLIEILWRQDIDLGIGREAFDIGQRRELEKQKEHELQKQREKEKIQEKLRESQATNNNNNITYIVDRETGEQIPAPPGTQIPAPGSQRPEHVPFTHVQQQPQNNEFSIEDAMRILESGVDNFDMQRQVAAPTDSGAIQRQLQELEAMMTNVTSERTFQTQNSIENHWQDIDSLLPLDGSTANTDLDLDSLLYNTTNSSTPVIPQRSLLNNASLAPQLSVHNLSFTDVFNTSIPFAPMLTPTENSSTPRLLPTEALGLGGRRAIGGGAPFVNSSETLLQQLLSDNITDVNFDDFNVTDPNGTQMMEVNDTSSDSAISSATASNLTDHTIMTNIGSPIEDFSDVSSPYDALEGATGGNSDTESSSGPYKPQETKYKYDPDYTHNDYSFSGHSFYRNHSGGDNGTDYNTETLPADPRHTRHNHSYPLQPGQSPKEHKSYKPIKEELDIQDAQYTRDQKRAKAMNIPFTMEEMITSAVEQFNDMLSEHQLTDPQLQLIRDIRRRGKNKVAAQNCRKRKLEVIQTLEEEVAQMRHDRDQLRNERAMLDKDQNLLRNKHAHLYQEVFQSLRDEHGHPYDPNEYSLQQTDDGEMFLVPHNATTVIKDEPKPKTSRKRKGDGKR